MSGSAIAAPTVAGVRVPGRGLRGDLRAVKIVWQRECLRFMSDRPRIIAALVQPVLFLFVLGTGLSRIASQGTHGVNLRTFVYPGALAMAVLFTAIFSAASIVWDREFGFLREMLVAPVRRGSIVLGKSLGGATVAGFQGVLVIALAGLVGVPYAPGLIIEVLVLQLMLAFALTAFGVMLAVRVKQMQSFMAITQMLLMPDVLHLGRAVPGRRPARLAHDHEPGRSDHLRGRSDPAGGVRPSRHQRRRPPRPQPGRDLVGLAPAGPVRGGDRGPARPRDARHRHLAVQPRRVAARTYRDSVTGNVATQIRVPRNST